MCDRRYGTYIEELAAKDCRYRGDRMHTSIFTSLFIAAVLAAANSSAAQTIPPVEFNPNASPFLQLLWARLGDIHGEVGAVESAEFSSDGRYIVSGGKYDNSLVSAHEDGTVRLWLWKSGDLDINIKHHYALKERQRAAAEARRKERAERGVDSR